MTLIFSIHYFLWYGALASTFGYESVYSRHYTNASTMQYGYLNMILPFLTVIATPMICSLADRKRLHRSFFTISLILTMLSYVFYALLPIIPSNKIIIKESPSEEKPLLLGAWIYFCLTSTICDLSMAVNTCLSDSFAVLQAEENDTSFGRVIVWGTFGYALSALILSLINQWTLLPRLVPGILFGAILLTIDVVIVSFWKRSTDFKLDIIPPNAAQILTGSSSSTHKDPNDYLPQNESALINLGNETTHESHGAKRRKTKSPIKIILENQNKKHKQSLSADSTDLSVTTINSGLATDIEQEATSTLKTIQTSQPISPRRQFMSTSVVTFMNPLVSSDNEVQPHANKLLLEQRITKFKEKSSSHKKMTNYTTSFRMQLLLLGLILKRRKALMRYLILFALSGFFMSMHWNYFFLYLEEIYYKKFELISALSMVGQSVLGELPFFILSKKLIDYFGRSQTLSISVISIGIRFILYGYLLPNSNMYYIVIADCFQGPNYGLFYVVMTEVGLEYSFCDDETIENLAARGEIDRNNKYQVDSVRLSLRSTIQSVAFACYEGIGVGLGSLTGGWIVSSFGFKTLWISMAICSITVGLINLIIDTMCKETDGTDENENSEHREFLEARRYGILTKLASPTPLPSARPLAPFKFQHPINTSNLNSRLELMLHSSKDHSAQATVTD